MIAMKDPLKIVGNNFISPFSEEMGRRISERYLTEYSSVLHGDLFHVITWLSDIFLGLEKVHFSLENRYILGGKININLSNIAVWQEKTSIMLSDISLGWRELHTNIQKNSNEQRYIFFWVKNRMFQQGNLPAVSVLSNIKKWQGETYTTVPDISPQQKEVHLYLKSNVVQEEKFLNLSRSALCQEKTSIMLSDISLGRKELHINASISRENNTKMQGKIFLCERKGKLKQGNLLAVSVLAKIKKWQEEIYTTVPDISPQQKEVHLYLKSNVVQEEKFLNLSRSALCQEKKSIMLSDISLGRKELHISATISRENNTKMQGEIYTTVPDISLQQKEVHLYLKSNVVPEEKFLNLSRSALCREKRSVMLSDVSLGRKELHISATISRENNTKMQGEIYTTVPDISPQQKEVHLYLKSNVVKEEKFLNLSRSALCREKRSVMLSDVSLGRKELHISATMSRENNTKMQREIFLWVKNSLFQQGNLFALLSNQKMRNENIFSKVDITKVLSGTITLREEMLHYRKYNIFMDERVQNYLKTQGEETNLYQNEFPAENYELYNYLSQVNQENVEMQKRMQEISVGMPKEISYQVDKKLSMEKTRLALKDSGKVLMEIESWEGADRFFDRDNTHVQNMLKLADKNTRTLLTEVMDFTQKGEGGNFHITETDMGGLNRFLNMTTASNEILSPRDERVGENMTLVHKSQHLEEETLMESLREIADTYRKTTDLKEREIREKEQVCYEKSNQALLKNMEEVVQKRMEVVSGQVYRDLERRFKSDKRRRGY